MPVTPLSRLFMVGDPVPSATQSMLESAGFAVNSSGFGGIDPTEVGRCQAVLFAVSPSNQNSAQALCRRWRIELGEQYVPLLWLAEADIPPQAGLDSGADIVLTQPVNDDHLLAQLKALLRIQHLHTRLASRGQEAQQLNLRLQQAFQQIDGDLDLTRRIQRAFLPKVLPEVGKVRVAACYRPRSRVGGDFYDVVRLDEKHLGLYIADAMGRGLPASSLLSIFVRKSIVTKEILGRSYRLVPPGETLDRLNRELVGLSLPEPPFVTMTYLQINCESGELTFARAAHPHPLYIPAVGEPTYWHSSGTLLGVFEADYPIQQRQLSSGDKLLLYTDGVYAPMTGPGSGIDHLVETAKRYRHLSIQPFVDQLSRELLEESHHAEDFTVVALEYK